MFTFQTLNRNACSIAVLALLASVTTAHAGGGSTTLTPANSIQAAINSGNFSEIILEPGTYFQLVNFNGAAITLRSTDPSDPDVVAATILDGEFLGDSVIKCTSGEGPDTVIDGLTIMHGEATTVDGEGSDRGGGLWCNISSPTVRNCVFIANEASCCGGGFYVNQGSTTLTNCTFIDNSATTGGGAYCNNSAVTFDRCVFESNDVINNGGGARVHTGTYLFIDCEFRNNSAQDGGGFYRASSGTTTIERCLFDGNMCLPANQDAGRGGGMRIEGTGAINVNNSVLTANAVNKFGAAIYCPTNIAVIRNCTSNGNVGQSTGFVDTAGGTGMDIVNCISWNDTLPAISGTGSADVSYCNIQGGHAGTGNIGGDSGHEPLFANAAAGNFRLLEGSSGIDAGNAHAVTGEYPLDFDLNMRALDDPNTPDTGLALLGISVDMGAFEFQPEGVGVPNTCPADIVSSDTFAPPPDGVVDAADLAYLLGAWGACD